MLEERGVEICYSCFREKKDAGVCPHCGYDPTGSEQKYPLALKPGSILNGRYIAGRVLGQGGFGITYIALDDATKDRVAIKEYLPAEFAGREPGGNRVQPHSDDSRENFSFGKEKFLEEAKTLAAFIGDEHIVRIYNYFEENGTAYFTMEYVEGRPLNKYMSAHGGRLTPEETNSLLLPLMEALEKVHAKGIVHRDIAPDNIIVQPNGKAKLIDFGAARYSTGEKSQSLDVVIKHGFAPYEQYTRRGRQGPFTDVYAMAATYYYTITGKIPPDAVERRTEDTLVPLETLDVGVSEATANAIYKALEVSAGDRFRTMGEFRQALTESDPELAARAAEERARREQERREREAAEQARREREAAERAKREEAAKNRQTEQIPQGKAGPKPARARSGKRLGWLALVGCLVVAGLAAVFLLPKGEKTEAVVPALPVETAAPIAAPAPTEEPEQDDLVSIHELKPLKEAHPGDMVVFGSYGQDNDTSNGKEDVEWLVLDSRDGRLLVISRYALDSQKYNVLGSAVTWEKSTLRGWLNGSFLYDSFTVDERMSIYEDTVNADKNPSYDTAPGETTRDKVFLLSIQEVEKYFPAEEDRTCLLTAYAASAAGYSDAEAACRWWLRTPGSSANTAAAVNSDGSVLSEGGNAQSTGFAVRPVLWIDVAAYVRRTEPAVIPQDTSVGDTIFFGHYEQDNDESNGKEEIEWFVLAREGNRILVLSRYVLDCQKYNIRTDSTWETCTLRAWLNDTFLNDAFSTGEQIKIPAVTVSADKNPKYNTDPGNDTIDRVFVLSLSEMDQYISSAEDRRCIATEYAKAHNCFTFDGYCRDWWLRTPGWYEMAVVDASGYSYSEEKHYFGTPVEVEENGVRPALWLEIDTE